MTSKGFSALPSKRCSSAIMSYGWKWMFQQHDHAYRSSKWRSFTWLFYYFSKSLYEILWRNIAERCIILKFFSCSRCLTWDLYLCSFIYKFATPIGNRPLLAVGHGYTHIQHSPNFTKCTELCFTPKLYFFTNTFLTFLPAEPILSQRQSSIPLLFTYFQFHKNIFKIVIKNRLHYSPSTICMKCMKQF